MEDGFLATEVKAQDAVPSDHPPNGRPVSAERCGDTSTDHDDRTHHQEICVLLWESLLNTGHKVLIDRHHACTREIGSEVGSSPNTSIEYASRNQLCVG